jgi:OmpA-OmpF porin, OOP family
MHSLNRRWSVLGIAILAGMMVVSGCASRKYVRNQVSTLEPAIQEASAGVKENAERIDAVDRRAQEGVTAAGAADTKATQAAQAAAAANTAAQAAQRQADTANQAVQQVNNRIGTIETRLNSVNDNYTVAETQTVTFRVNSSTLSDQAKGTLDTLAMQVSGQRTGYMIELQGFTDNRGSENYNINLSQRRAESVLRYLVSKNIPLFRVSIVGLGEDNPVAPNNTRQGRDQNRRVEVKLLRSAGAGTTN